MLTKFVRGGYKALRRWRWRPELGSFSIFFEDERKIIDGLGVGSTIKIAAWHVRAFTLFTADDLGVGWVRWRSVGDYLRVKQTAEGISWLGIVCGSGGAPQIRSTTMVSDFRR
jgi:hypothetical protein